MVSPFTRKTLAFLRALKRHNDRDWFRRRKEDYETRVRGPMIQLLARLAEDFRGFAPELIADPRVSLYRIYRDTRFSDDKRPLKTHVAAHFPAKGFARNAGAGLYLEIAPGWVWIGGGLYMPSPADLRAIRTGIASQHRKLRRILTAPAFRRTVGQLEGERLSRVPLGYPKDHPAAEYLRFKQFLAGCEYEAEFAYDRRFYRELLTVFRAVAPLVRFLNGSLVKGSSFHVPHVTSLRDRTSQHWPGGPPVARPGVHTRPTSTPALPPLDGAPPPDRQPGAPRRLDRASTW